MDVEKTIEFILQMQAKAEAWLEKMREREEALAARQEAFAAEHDRDIAAIRDQLKRAVRLSVQEARAERKRRKEMDARFDEKIIQLAAAQLVTEEKLQGLIESMRSGTNGRPEPPAAS